MTTPVAGWSSWSSNTSSSIACTPSGPVTWATSASNMTFTVTSVTYEEAPGLDRVLTIERPVAVTVPWVGDREPPAPDPADERAAQLLRTVLNDTQWEAWERDRRFEQIGSAGGRYRIRHGVSGNVELLTDRGFVAEELCCHPSEPLPVADVIAAQVLALRTDEPGFRDTANITLAR